MTVFETNAAVENALNNLPLYAMYLRKSRADLELEALGEGETLAKHRALLEALAARHNISMNQVTVYQELISGDSIDERPEMQRLLYDVFAKKYKGVLVVEIERLARGNTKDQGEVAEAFQTTNTLIITPAKVYDPNNEFDQEYFEFGLFMSRREYKTIKRRLEMGKLLAVQDGNYIPSTPPYGFDVERKSRKERILKEKPEESKYVKMIFDWYTEDRKPTSWIAKQLSTMGVPTKKKAEKWERTTITGILFNVHYIGKVSWGEQVTIKEKDPITGKIVKKRKYHGSTQVYDGKHDGFISEEQFAKVKTIYGTQAPAKINTELVNPLSGIMVCCDCGRAMRYQSYSDNRIDRFHHALGVKCHKKSLQSPVVLDALVDVLNAYLQDFQVKMETQSGTDEVQRHKATLDAMESELKKAEQKKRKLLDSWEAEDGMYTKEEYIERKQMYAATIENMKRQIQEFKANTPKPVNCEEQITTIRALIECVKNPDLDARSKNIFLKQFIDKITYDSIDLGKGRGGKAVLEVFLK